MITTSYNIDLKHLINLY